MMKIIMVIALVMPSMVFAFKVDTHVWVGQQVINDLADDGRLSFKIGDKNVKIAIDLSIKSAILNNQSDYLIGHIGPDAAPDVVVGQTVIHSGING